jgi:hypothetical protein
MRLTKFDREAFVRAVMADVPTVDYDEQAKQLMQQAAYDAMPAKVKAVYDDKDARKYLKCEYYSFFPGCLANAYIYRSTNWQHPDATDKALRELEVQKVAQEIALNELKAKLTGIINSCNTLKKAKELLPEFEKYLPEERDTVVTNNLPAVTGLVTDLMKLGWPKGKQPQAVAA